MNLERRGFLEEERQKRARGERREKRKGDPDEGEDGELYEALGYVRKSERKSGLRRGKAPATDPVK